MASPARNPFSKERISPSYKVLRTCWGPGFRSNSMELPEPVSDRLPHFSKVVDDVSFIKTLQTDQFNHGPAQLMVHSGQPRIGYPSIGSWATWGMGTENADLPGFVVLLSGGRIPRVGTPLGIGLSSPVYQGSNAAPRRSRSQCIQPQRMTTCDVRP